jgi:hypothetical protein
MNNQLPMFVPGAGKTPTAKPNDVVGLNSSRLDDSQINNTLFQYIDTKPSPPPPKGTVGECQTMRERILQLSLFPSIYHKVGKVKHPGNVDFGNID